MIGNTLRKLEQIGMAIAVLCMVAIMLTIAADALMRYSFNAPLQWAAELVTNYLIIVVVYFSVSAAFSHGDHISLPLFRPYIPAQLRKWVDVGWCVMAAIVFSIIALGTLEHVIDAYVSMDFIPGFIPWPAWLSYLPIPIGCVIIALRLFHHGIILATKGHDEAVAEESEAME